MTVSVNPQNTGRTVSGRGKALFVLMTAVIAAAFLTAGCGGKASAKVGQKPPAGFWSGGVDTDWYDEDEDEFVINTAEELAGLAELVNDEGESFNGKTVRLGRDIVINDTANWRGWTSNPPAHSWTGIGTDEERFQGTFDGGGYTVSGVYIKNSEDDQGLFGVVGYHGKVKRLNVIASYIEGGNYAGILAGGSNGVIAECYASGIVVGDSIVGGLAGVNDRMIINSYAAGSVKGRINVGGFMGANREGAAAGNHSAVSVLGDSIAGGFVGANWGGMINGNFSTGKVTGSADIGGFAGRGYGGMMRNNYYDKETSGQSDSGKGEGRTTAQMQGAELVDSLNVVAGILSLNAWIRSEGGYPASGGKPAAPVSMDGYFASGKGTGDDPYMISTGRQLEDFAWLVNLGARFSGKHLKLSQDIALNDTANWQKWAAEPPARVWVPAGTQDSPFDGILDGGGHAVSGVYVNDPSGFFLGLFGTASEDAVIKNIGVTASYIRGHSGIGGLVGWNLGRIVGSYSAAIVAGEETAVGGLVGGNKGGAIIGCYATGAVSGGEIVGGLAGANANNGTIRNSYSTGATASTGMAENSDCGAGCGGVGGLVGLNNLAAINACYTVSAVTAGADSKFIGPIVGWNHLGRVAGSYFDSETSGVEGNGAGSGKTTEQMKQKETFAGWDFNTVWIMDPAVNGGYPHLSGKFDESAADDLDDEDDEDDDDD